MHIIVAFIPMTQKTKPQSEANLHRIREFKSRESRFRKHIQANDLQWKSDTVFQNNAVITSIAGPSLVIIICAD